MASSYIHASSLRKYDSQILPDYLDRRAKEHPEKEAAVIYTWNGERDCLTFKQYHDQSIKLAAGLLKSGLSHGDRALLVAPNTLEFILIQMAFARIGVFLLLLKFGATPDEVIQESTHYKCKATIFQSSKSREGYGHTVVQALREKDPQVNVDNPLVVCVSFDGGQDTVSYDYLMGPNPDSISDEEKVAVSSAQSHVQMDDLLLGMMTSGSTGRPKVVAVNHCQFLQMTFLSSETCYMEDSSRFLNERPFTWAGAVAIGVNFIPVIGLTLVSMDPEISVKKADAGVVKKILQDERCTHLLAMPYMMYDFIAGKDAQNYDLSHLKIAMTGGQPILQESAVAFLEKNPTLSLIECYGTAEALLTFSKMTNLTNVADPNFGFLSIVNGIEAKVIDDNQRLVPRGIVGELCLRGPQVFSGYLDNPDATARAITPLRWFRTSDMVVMNEQGQIRIVGRMSDTIKRATVKVQPAEIEEVLVQHPNIVQTYVVGVPDVRLFEDLCACIQLQDGDTPVDVQLKEIDTWCKETFKPGPDGLTLAPRYILDFQTFPKTGSGKINRRELKETATKRLGLTRDTNIEY